MLDQLDTRGQVEALGPIRGWDLRRIPVRRTGPVLRENFNLFSAFHLIAQRLLGGLAVWRYDGLAVWRYDGLAVWPHGVMAVWLYDGLATPHAIAKTRCPKNFIYENSSPYISPSHRR